MDKRIYDAIEYLKHNSEDEASKHVRELLSVCKDYVKSINELDEAIDYVLTAKPEHYNNTKNMLEDFKLVIGTLKR